MHQQGVLQSYGWKKGNVILWKSPPRDGFSYKPFVQVEAGGNAGHIYFFCNYNRISLLVSFLSFLNNAMSADFYPRCSP